MVKMNEKNISANKFEKAYIASITNVRLGGPNLTKDESEFVEMPLPVKEMIDEIMKAKYNSDMEKLRQEIKESKIQHEFVEELRKEIRNLHEKLGDVEQEKIILNSLVSKIRDVDSNVMICQKTIDKVTQEIKESKIQHEFVEELRKEIRNLHEKLGDVEQEKIILNSLVSKIRDVDSNVMICQKTIDKVTQEIKESKIQHEFVEELRKEIRNLHEKLGDVEQENKTQLEKEKNHELAQIKKIQNITRQEPDMSNNSKKMEPKNGNISLVLSIVLGLVGLSGISHIYLGKIQKGVGILVVSFILIGATGYFINITMSQNMFDLLSILHSFVIVPLVGYFGFFAWQIFDARKLCLKYNKYVTDSGKLPPWW